MRKQILFVIVMLAGFGTAAIGQTIEQLNASALEAFNKQDFAAAEAAIDAVLKKQPANQTALTLRARTFIRQAKFAEALATAEKILVKNPNNFEALNVRGVAKRELKRDFSGALADFTKVVEIKPDYYIGVLNLGLTYMRMARGEDAKAALTKAIALGPEIPDTYELRGRNSVNLRRYKEAIPDYDKAVALNPQNDAVIAQRAYAHFRIFIDTADYPPAKFNADAERVLQLNARSALALALRAAFRFQSKDTAGAIADADRALQINPKMFTSHMVRGFIKFNQKDYNGSFDEIEKAAEMMPGDAWVRGKREEALDRATSPRAVALKEDLARIKTATAEKDLAAAKQRVAADPWNLKSYEALNDAFGRFDPLGDRFAARDYWEKLVAENPQNICAIRFLGEYKHDGYWRNMATYLEEGLRKYDGKNGTECAADIAFRLGREYNSRNLFNEAEVSLSKAKQLNPTIAYLDNQIDTNRAEKADADKPFPKVTSPTPTGGARTKPGKTLSGLDRVRIEAALKDYDRVHAQIERELTELIEANNKYVKGGAYAFLYKGTYQRIGTIKGRIYKIVRDLLQRQGEWLPQELKDHLDEDLAKISSVDPGSPYQ